MPLELTREQQQALDHNPAAPLPLIDPRSGAAYVLLRADLFERLKGLICYDDFDSDEAMPFVNEIMAEDDADDPLLESYQQYRNPS